MQLISQPGAVAYSSVQKKIDKAFRECRDATAESEQASTEFQKKVTDS